MNLSSIIVHGNYVWVQFLFMETIILAVSYLISFLLLKFHYLEDDVS
jgi:hypothetical protein